MTGSAYKKRMIPTDALRNLARNSMEHLHLRIDDALSENAKLFVGESKQELSRLATFSDYVIAGTDDGSYFKANYLDNGKSIVFSNVESVDVPVVDSKTYRKYVNDIATNIAEAVLTGTVTSDQLVSLMTLDESIDDDMKDLASLVDDIVTGLSDWKSVYNEQKSIIVGQIGDAIKVIDESSLSAKYTPLYDGTIPEEKFHQYLDLARNDLSVIENRLTVLEDRIEAAYMPFSEKLANVTLPTHDRETVEQFVSFADGVAEEVHNLREHVKIAIANEQCAMCLGQIYDTIAESLNDYEIAGSFVERMAVRFTTTEN